MLRYVILAFFAAPSIVAVLADCGDNEWQCADKSACISLADKCDGSIQCDDQSDEDHATCRQNICAVNMFRCTYGACVSQSAKCNGVKDCIDGSDELLPECSNRTLVDNAGFFHCNNGEQISADKMCDGLRDCSDESDERLETCSLWYCPSYQFQCAYGACVVGDAACDAAGIHHCIDGSDETDLLCNRTANATASNHPSLNFCVLPEHPVHGSYSVEGWPGARPGQSFADVNITSTCEPPYALTGEEQTSCSNGQWVAQLPECKQFCELKTHPSVTYYCGDRVCNGKEPSGTEVQPRCNDNYSQENIQHMTCIFTDWDKIVTCEPVKTTEAPTTTLATPLVAYYTAEECNQKQNDTIEMSQTGNNVTLVVNDHVVIFITGAKYTVSLSTENIKYNTQVDNAPTSESKRDHVIAIANVEPEDNDIVSNSRPNVVNSTNGVSFVTTETVSETTTARNIIKEIISDSVANPEKNEIKGRKNVNRKPSKFYHVKYSLPRNL